MTPFVRVAFLFELGLAGVAFLIGWAIGINPWRFLTIDLRGLGFGIAATGPMVVLLLVCDRDWFRPLRRIRDILETLILPSLRGRPGWELALIAGAAGVGEETLFRGLLQDGLQEWLGLWPALMIASVVFGLLHAMTLTYAILATVIGLYLGALHVISGNLLVPIVAHGLYDLIALIYFLRTARDDTIGQIKPHREEETLP